jgi:2-beta-glucuronyltransferase
VVRKADLIVVESCAAVLLFETLRSLAPKRAKIVYCASDRLETVGMHPMLADTLARTAASYDLIRVPAKAMISDFPSSARVAFIPHGIDKAAFSDSSPSPFESTGPHVVVAGDMLFDASALNVLLNAFPEVAFHAFGRMKLDTIGTRPNLRAYGEVPFADLASHLLHADIGFAPYLDRPEAYYLVESSLKLIQYTYCRLPIVAPHFASAGRPHVIGYAADDPASIVQALHKALAYDRSTIDARDVVSWDEVIARMLEAVSLQGLLGMPAAQAAVTASA